MKPPRIVVLTGFDLAVVIDLPILLRRDADRFQKCNEPWRIHPKSNQTEIPTPNTSTFIRPALLCASVRIDGRLAITCEFPLAKISQRYSLPGFATRAPIARARITPPTRTRLIWIGPRTTRTRARAGSISGDGACKPWTVCPQAPGNGFTPARNLISL